MDDTELFKIAVPALITVCGFVLTYLLTKSNLQRELQKQRQLEFMDRVTAIQYDLHEILQIAILDHLKIPYSSQAEEAKISEVFPCFIPFFRNDPRFSPENTSLKKRIYMLSDSVLHRSNSVTKIFLLLYDEVYRTSIDIQKVMALIALAYSQMRYDADRSVVYPVEWLRLRLPNWNDFCGVERICRELVQAHSDFITPKLCGPGRRNRRK